MPELPAYFGDLHQIQILPPYAAGTILVLVSVICGTIAGLEREAKNKPAGLRTVSMICVGSTIFTLASILIAGDLMVDRGRIAAQVVTGVGFLGAGAIIRERGTIVGLTTGATIWTVAAIGVLIGAGYAAGGLILTLIIVGMLRGARRFERGVRGGCRYGRCQVVYKPHNSKVRLQVFRVLDEFRIPDRARSVSREGELEAVQIEYCTAHRSHRGFLYELANMPEVLEIRQATTFENHGVSGSA